MANYGTNALNDLDAYGNLAISAIGENRAYDLIKAAVDAQNRLLTDFVPFAETTTDFRRRYGASDDMTMDFVDEFGRADAQKVLAASDVDIPLLLAQRSLQWTRDAFRRMSGAQMAAQMDALMQGDVRAVILAFKQALFIPTNRTVIDRHATGVSLAVKALVNADSAPIPLGPNGESFNAATHTHYLGTASFVAADLTALILTVIEHYGNVRPMVYINSAQEAAVRGFAGFTAYVDARIVQPGGSTTPIGSRPLDMLNPNNRAIGIFGAAEVWVKPWMPANYVFCWGDGGPKPLLRRIDPVTGGNLELVAENEQFPLRATTFERRFGFGAWNRTNGAVLLTNNATYSAPTLAA
jgi:hypothetical protein